MTNEITSTNEMAEAEWDGTGEDGGVRSDIVATKEAEGRGIEFHVSMRDYTKNDMEALIVEAAARQIVGAHNERQIAKEIEAKCIEQINKKIGIGLDAVTTEIIDRPITPNFGDKKPVTMREFIGLVGREYLAAKVQPDGSASEGRWNSNTTTRAEWFATRHMERTFESEIKKATSAAINEVRAAIVAQHKAFLEEEKKRFRDALAATISPA